MGIFDWLRCDDDDDWSPLPEETFIPFEKLPTGWRYYFDLSTIGRTNAPRSDRIPTLTDSSVVIDVGEDKPHYMMRAAAPRSKLIMSGVYKVEPGTVFMTRETYKHDPEPVEGAHFGPIIRHVDDLTSENNRWWGPRVPMYEDDGQPQIWSLEIPLAPDYWSNVNGKRAYEVIENWKKFTLRGIQQEGITFGGDGTFGHGLYIQRGHCTITVEEFRWE